MKKKFSLLIPVILLAACNGGGTSGGNTPKTPSGPSDPATPPKPKNDAPQYPVYHPVNGLSSAQEALAEANWLASNIETRNESGEYSKDGKSITFNQIFTSNFPKSYGNGIEYFNYLTANNTDYQNYLSGADGNGKHDSGACDVSPGNEATIERILVDYGLDVYDGAVWQIALSLEAYHAGNISAEAKSNFIKELDNYNTFLHTGDSGFVVGSTTYSGWEWQGKPQSVTITTAPFGTYRASGNGMSYNPNMGVYFAQGDKEAYWWKFVAPSGMNLDDKNKCAMAWPSYEGVTGEQAWAGLIGPIQTAYNILGPDFAKNPASQQYIDLAINSLTAIKYMQADNGGVYRNVRNVATNAPDRLSISLENNFSLYAGLDMLEQTLNAQNYDKNSEAYKNLEEIKSKLTKFLLSDGITNFNPNDNSTDQYYYTANDKGEFIHHDFAVDVQSWGATVIASDPNLWDSVTAKFGVDAPYKMIKSAIDIGGYYDASGSKLLGVGYTTQKAGDKHYVMSGEWTLGLINAAIVVAQKYSTIPGNEDKVNQLESWTRDMIAGINGLSNYDSSNAANPKVSLLYASSRVFIPFGWWSNKVPATSSTGWGLFLNRCYNPFILGGGTETYKPICQAVGIN